MTEIYHGPWSPTKGDLGKSKVEYDPYHPIYPAVNGEHISNNGKNEPVKVTATAEASKGA